MNMYYVYGHYTDDTNELFYIGKGSGYRSSQLSGKRRNQLWKNIANKHGVVVKILYENLSEEQAFEMEIKLIKEFGRRDIGTGILANMTDGGEGGSGANLPGRKLSIAEREHLSKTLKGRSKPPRSPEHCENISKSKMGKKLGKFTEEHRLKISLSNKGKVFTEEHKQKLSAAKKGKRRPPITEETREKMSMARRNYYNQQKNIKD